MGCMQSADTNIYENIRVLELNSSIDSSPTVIDESSNVVLRYRTPYFRAVARVQVPPLVRKEIWTVGWIQACNKMDFFNYYGEEGMYVYKKHQDTYYQFMYTCTQSYPISNP